MLGHADSQACLGYVVAKRCSHRQGMRLVEQKRAHLLADHFHGGMVECQVVEQQDGGDPIIRRVLGVDHAQQRRLGDVQAVMAGVKARMQLFNDAAVGRVQGDGLHRQRCFAPDHLHRAVQAFPDHPGAQDVVTRHDLLQRAHKGVQALKAVKRHARLQQVRVALLGADMVIENAFLQWRQRVDILHIGRAARDCGDDALDGALINVQQRQHRRGDTRAARWNAVGRHHNLAPAADRRRQCGKARLAEQHTHIGTQTHLAHAFDQADRKQRMPTQLEEMVMAPDAFQLEHVLPDLRQQGFHRAFRRLIATAEQRTRPRHRQALAVEFAVGGQRQQFQPDIGRRHHVIRQLALHVGTQRFDFQRGLGGVVGHQAFIARLVFAGHDHRILDTGERGQAALYFSGLDAETADLHLQVIAPLVQQITVGLPTGQVAGAVKLAFTKGVRDKLFGGQLRLVQVAVGHARTADIQFADHAQRQRLLARIQHVGLRIRNRPPNRHAARARRADFKRGGERGGFGRAVAVQQVLGLTVVEHAADHQRVKHIAADNQVAQLTEHRQQCICVLMEQACGHPQHADRLLLQQRSKGRLGQQHRMLDHHHTTAIEQRRPHVEGAGVKGRVGREGHTVTLIEIGVAVVEHQARDRAVRHLHAFRRAGGAGGVHDVRHAVGRLDQVGIAR